MFRQFTRLAGAAPELPALIDGTSGMRISRAELRARAERRAAELRSAGLGSRDLIAVQLPNSSEFVETWLAALMLDLVFIPIDRDATEMEVGAILSHFAVRGLVYRADTSLPGVTISVRSAGEQLPLPKEARLIKLTSGSTGLPKGIVTSEANLAADCRNIVSSMGIRPDDINLGSIPFSHSYGFSNLISPLVMQGTPIVVSNDYIPQSIIDLCNQYRCTVVPGVPMMFDHLANTSRTDGDFAHVRTFISAGAPLPPSTSKRFRERFGNDIHSFYGCSECGGISYDREGAAVERGTVGNPLDGVSFGLRSSRLTVRSSSVALGYLGDDRAFHPFDDGRFTTDDLVELRERGEVALIGRASELINIAGKKVNPREVELIIQQIEGVRQVKVYGEPAGARGDVVAAAIVASPDLTREAVREFCRARLSSHKVPRIVKLIEAIPVDERGKVKRAALATL